MLARACGRVCANTSNRSGVRVHVHAPTCAHARPHPPRVRPQGLGERCVLSRGVLCFVSVKVWRGDANTKRRGSVLDSCTRACWERAFQPASA
eukprot:3436734-Pleurochrysis_carterae.AAC.6